MATKLQALRKPILKALIGKRLFIFIFSILSFFNVSAQIMVSSIAELANVALQSNQTVTMTPGVYDMIDYLTPTVIANNTPADEFGRRAMLLFSGSNNTFDFAGVTINVDTALLNDLGSHVIEVHLTGNTINFKGLKIIDIGNSPTAGGGQSFVVSGEDTIVENVTLNMAGSSPYGYGDLLGKGGGSLVPMRKHSGLLVGGLNVSIIGCSIYSQSFGHLFFIQGGRNVLFQDCYAEAVMRTTDNMLAETSGTAFNLDFEAVWPNYNGDKVIAAGYTKSLSECGFRTYGSGAGNNTGALTFINCKAVNARVGFALTRVDGDILVQDCEAVGNEAGYNVNGVTIENSRGDAVNGPLLYLAGDASEVELFLMTTVATTTLHAIATIAGNNHKVTLKEWNDVTRPQVHTILMGATRPTGTNPFSPLGEEGTSGVTLNNCTEMPVEVYSIVNSSKVNSNGVVTDNGTGNTIDTTNCIGSDSGAGDEGLIDEIYDITASSTDPDPFYGWDPDFSSTYGYMAIDEANDQLVCTFENNGSDYIRFYWRKLDPNQHKINSNNYPILAMKGKRPDNYSNFTLNLNNTTGAVVQFKEGKSENGAETLAYSKLLPGTTDVYYWDLFNMIPATETWELNGFNCVNTQEVNPISVMRLDYLKTFINLYALNDYEGLLSTKENYVSSKLKLFPNPSTHGSFNLNSINLYKAHVNIYNMLGELVFKNHYAVSSKNFTVQHNLKTGIYIVKLNNTSVAKLSVK